MDYYSILGINEDASIEEIREAYIRQVNKFKSEIKDERRVKKFLKLFDESYEALLKKNGVVAKEIDKDENKRKINSNVVDEELSDLVKSISNDLKEYTNVKKKNDILYNQSVSLNKDELKDDYENNIKRNFNIIFKADNKNLKGNNEKNNTIDILNKNFDATMVININEDLDKTFLMSSIKTNDNIKNKVGGGCITECCSKEEFFEEDYYDDDEDEWYDEVITKIKRKKQLKSRNKNDNKSKVKRNNYKNNEKLKNDIKKDDYTIRSNRDDKSYNNYELRNVNKKNQSNGISNLLFFPLKVMIFTVIAILSVIIIIFKALSLFSWILSKIIIILSIGICAIYSYQIYNGQVLSDWRVFAGCLLVIILSFFLTPLLKNISNLLSIVNYTLKEFIL